MVVDDNREGLAHVAHFTAYSVRGARSALEPLHALAVAVGAPRHAPFTHSSPTVQALPSSQIPVSCVWRQPLTGSHASVDDGSTWKELDRENYNSVAFTPEGEGWAVGPKGRVVRFGK